MAYARTAPGWAPDYMEAVEEGGRSVKEQHAAEVARWKRDPANPDRVEAGVVVEPLVPFFIDYAGAIKVTTRDTITGSDL